MCLFLSKVLRSGGWITVANPLSSHLWKLPCVRALQAAAEMSLYRIDMCAFGLQSPPMSENREYWQKSTGLLASAPCFEKLQRVCRGLHAHSMLKGCLRVGGKSVSRSQLAAKFPSIFCAEYARVSRALAEGGEAAGP